MKYLSFFILECLLIFNARAQVKPHPKIAAVSIGRTSFGTGDILGLGVATEFSKRISKEPKHFFGGYFYLGAEVKFEAGTKQPKVINPSLQEFFFGVTFNQTANIVFTPKAIYFPISKTFLKGINVSIGPSIGYTYQSSEFHATLIYDSSFQTNVRRSYLEYNNAVLLGYRVTVGYQYLVFKHVILGIRLDFDSYSNGDINTLLAGKIGYAFK